MKENVILVIGACTLDRIITVTEYPKEDSKGRSQSIYETGGGNAANTATAISKLCSPTLLSKLLPSQTKFEKEQQNESSIKVKLLTKLGNDAIHQQLCNELIHANVDISSDLFLQGNVGTTSSITTVIVSEKKHTRTCIFTPGTCGEITEQDVINVKNNGRLEHLFENVIHLHSDSRHTKAAILLATEARQRGISVSVDIERDRGPAMDELLNLATVVFTNQDQMSTYMKRQCCDWKSRYEELQTNSSIVSNPTICLTDTLSYAASIFHPGDFYSLQKSSLMSYITASANLIYHLFRRYDKQHKDLIITRGEEGSLYIQHDDSLSPEQPIRHTPTSNKIPIFEYNKENEIISIYDDYDTNDRNDESAKMWIQKYAFHIMKVGVLKNVHIADTTGAGDSFIGCIIFHSILAQLGLYQHCHLSKKETLQFAMMLSTWVAGKKLEGLGSRKTLPNGDQLLEELGSSIKEIQENLKKNVSSS